MRRGKLKSDDLQLPFFLFLISKSDICHRIKMNKMANAAALEEGYIYASYGKEKYLRHVIASVLTLRRYDQKRPVALVCDRGHIDHLKKTGLDKMFKVIHEVGEEHCSIVGFKHFVYKFSFFDRNLFLDSDIVWCKNPDRLWESFRPYPYTITGNLKADVFFGAPKGLGILKVILLGQRKRTLKRFGLTYLSRVQSGLIYVYDKKLSKEVCQQANQYLQQIDQTHFQTRFNESGRKMESCEWSLAMAMSKYNLPTFPWMIGHESPQLDFIDNYTEYDEDFNEVKCKFYTDPFVYSLRGLKVEWLQKFLTRAAGISQGKSDYIMVTPYCLHFGWLHEKEPFLKFADRAYDEIISGNHHNIIFPK